MNYDKWDLRFLELAKHISTWSKDPSTKCGAVLVNPRWNIISVGYNGLPQNLEDTLERYDNRELKYDLIIHAEMNALTFADKNQLKDFICYTYPFAPCIRCAVHLLQHRVARVVAPICPKDKLERWEKSLALTREMFKEANVEFREMEMK